MRRKPVLFFVAVSAFCMFGGSFANGSALGVSSVKGFTDTEDFAITYCYSPPALEELFFTLTVLFTPFFTFALIIERWTAYYKTGKQIKTFKADEHSAARDFMARNEYEKESGKSMNCISEIVAKTLAESSTPYTNQSRPRLQIEQIRHRLVMLKSARFEERLWVIIAIAITMPLFCIFGSMITLSETFTYMNNESAGAWTLVYDLETMADTLAWALGTSIPAFWMYRRFLSRAKTLTAELDQSSAKLLDLVLNFQPAPWLLERKSALDMHNTQSLGRSTAGLNLNHEL